MKTKKTISSNWKLNMNKINSTIMGFVSLLLLAFSYGVAAVELSDSDIQKDLESNPLFLLGTSSERYQRSTTEYIENSVPEGLLDLEYFYQSLEESYPGVLGDPNYIPILVGDITTIIPIYNEPRYFGSPLVQSRYIRTQIRSMLGRNLIDADIEAYANQTAQINTLYENAFYYIQNYGVDIEYGDRLELDPAASGLVVDLVWPEKRMVNGEEVIVPIVYLTQSTYESRKVTDHVTTFNDVAAFGNLSIENLEIEFGRDAFLYVAGQLESYRGKITGNGNLEIAVRGLLNNISAIIQAKLDLKISAHSINSETLVHRYDFGSKKGGSFGEIAGIDSLEGDVYLEAYQDILIQGGIVGAPEGAITFTAGGNIYIGPVQYIESSNSEDQWGYSRRSRTLVLQSYLSAEDTIKLIAEGAIKIDASEIVSDQGHIEILAKLGVTIEDELETSQYNYFRARGDVTTQVDSYRTVAMRSLLDAGKGIRIHTEYGDLTLRAVDISSAQGTSVSATNGGVNLLMTTENDHYSYSRIEESLFTIKTQNKGRDIQTGVYNTIVGGVAVEALSGVRIQYEGFDTDKAALKRFGKKKSEISLNDQVEQLSKLPGLEWMAEMQSGTPNVEWEQIELRYDTWDESTTTLSPAMVAVISIAMNFVAPGFGEGLWQTMMAAGVGTFNTQVLVAGINGALSGDFGVTEDQLFEDDALLKSMASSMITAGVVHSINSAFFTPSDAEIQNGLDLAGAENWNPAQIKEYMDDLHSLSLGQQVAQAVSRSTTDAAVSSLVYGSNFGEQLGLSLVQTGINHLGQALTNSIVTATSNSDINYALELVVHTGSGCLVGTINSAPSGDFGSDEACASGALGAVVSTIATDIYAESNKQKINDLLTQEAAYIDGLLWDDELTNVQVYNYVNGQDNVHRASINDLQASGVDIAKLSAALGALVAGLDVDNAAATGASFSNYTLQTMAIPLIASLNEAVKRDELIGKAKVDVRDFDQNAQELLNVSLLAQAKDLQILLLKDEAGVVFIREGLNSYRAIYNDELLRNLIQTQLEVYARNAANLEKIVAASRAAEEFKRQLKILVEDGKFNAALRAADALNEAIDSASNVKPVLIFSFSDMPEDEFSSQVEEGVFIGANWISFGTLGMALNFIGIETETPVTNSNAEYLYQVARTELEENGIDPTYLDETLTVVQAVVQIKNVKETGENIWDLGTFGMEMLKRHSKKKKDGYEPGEISQIIDGEYPVDAKTDSQRNLWEETWEAGQEAIDDSSNNQLRNDVAVSIAEVDGMDLEVEPFFNFDLSSRGFGGVDPDSADDIIEILDVDEYMNSLEGVYLEHGEELHDVMKDRIVEYLEESRDANGDILLPRRKGLPGTHAEIRSVNSIMGQITDLESIIIDAATARLLPGSEQGNPFEACCNCTGILCGLDFVNVITGIYDGD